MIRLFRHKKILLLVLLLTITCFSIACISIWMIYINARSNLADRLTDIVNREKSAILVWRNYYHASESDIINYLQQVRKGENSIGEKGEIVVARVKEDSIEFIVGNPHIRHIYKSPRIRSLESPVFAALNGNSGFVRNRDYRGIESYASYVYLKEMKWGIIAKIPVSEIDGPYFRTAFYVLFLTIIVVIICSHFFIRITNPLIDNIIISERKDKRINLDLQKNINELEKSKINLLNSES